MKKNNITDAINDAVDESKFIMKEKNLKFHVSIPEKSVSEFVFDNERIKIVLRNILDNSTTYTQSGGKINVSLKTDNDYATIKVEDTGMGISKENLPKVFTKFFRSKKAIQTETDRSGLGLFIAKEIIEAHSGKINVESKEGKGTIVTIKLPISR